jgi:hypothetical protein
MEFPTIDELAQIINPVAFGQEPDAQHYSTATWRCLHDLPEAPIQADASTGDNDLANRISTQFNEVQS